MTGAPRASARTTREARALAGPGLLILLGILLAAANLRAAITSVGPVLEDIRAELDVNAVTSSVLVSVPVIAFAVCSPIAPLVARRFGIERTIAGMLVVLAVAIAGRSLPLPGTVWIGTALLGAAIAFVNVLLPALIKRDFPTRVGPVTGLYSSVQSVFAAVAAGVAVPVAAAFAGGWRVSLGMWAGLAVIALLVFLPQLKRRTEPLEGPVLLRPAGSRFRTPWSTAIGWQVTLYMGLQSTVYYSLITWWPTIDRSQGISAEVAGVHQFVLQISGIVGNVAAAALIHRLKDQRMLIAGAAGVAFVGLAGELVLPEFALVWAALAGAGGGASIVTALSMFGLRTRHHEQAAALSGMAQSVGYLLAASGPILLGLLHETTGGWTAPLAVLLGVTIAQLTVGVFAGRARRLPE
ncbi:MAG TPA: MFS transporter [Naasia sp.]